MLRYVITESIYIHLPLSSVRFSVKTRILLLLFFKPSVKKYPKVEEKIKEIASRWNKH